MPAKVVLRSAMVGLRSGGLAGAGEGLALAQEAEGAVDRVGRDPAVLDRLDGVLFTIVVAYYVSRAVIG